MRIFCEYIMVDGETYSFNHDKIEDLSETVIEMTEIVNEVYLDKTNGININYSRSAEKYGTGLFDFIDFCQELIKTKNIRNFELKIQND